MQTSRKVGAGALVLLLAAAGCTGGGGTTAGPTSTTTGARSTDPAALRTIGGGGGGGGPRFLASVLTAFDACDDLLAHLKAEGLERVGPWGLGGYGGPLFLADSAGDRAAAPTAEASSGGAPVPATSGTNNQEAGVDEPDLVKTDGSVLVAVTGGRLHVVDVSGPTPVETATLGLDRLAAQQVFLAGSRAWVLASAQDVGRGPRLAWSYGSSTTTVVEVDLSDPAAPREVQRLTMDGWQVAARLSEGALRLVLRADQPNGLEFQVPEGNGLRAEREALAANRAVIEGSTMQDWLPWAVQESPDGTTSEGSLVDCDAVARPEAFSGFGVLTVVTIDAAAPLAVADAVGVLSAGETVYASPEHLYVATMAVDQPGTDTPGATDAIRAPEPTGSTTAVHAFDVSDPTATRYVASGTVPGTLLSQFSMDEDDGVLRVASTRGSPWGGGADASDSLVTTLGFEGDELVQLGQVDGLGKGEAIQSVRFLGDVGYVVTFRQTDPLYTVDLSDPAHPAVVGELKINGWSAYLHPVADGFLVGVGQDATDTGRAIGTQVSLFDVRDPANPTWVAQHVVTDSWSEVQQDHHAFLHWAPTGLTVVPVWSYDGRGRAEVLQVQDGVLDEVGSLSHGDEPGGSSTDATIRRSMVVGDQLLTVSDRGLLSSSLGDLAEVAWLPWS